MSWMDISAILLLNFVVSLMLVYFQWEDFLRVSQFKIAYQTVLRKKRNSITRKHCTKRRDKQKKTKAKMWNDSLWPNVWLYCGWLSKCLPAVTPRTCTRFGSSGGVNVGAGWWSSEILHNNSLFLSVNRWPIG